MERHALKLMKEGADAEKGFASEYLDAVIEIKELYGTRGSNMRRQDLADAESDFRHQLAKNGTPAPERILSKTARQWLWGMGKFWGPEVNGLPVGEFAGTGRRIHPTTYTSEAAALESIADATEFHRHDIRGFSGECAVVVRS